LDAEVEQTHGNNHCHHRSCSLLLRSQSLRSQRSGRLRHNQLPQEDRSLAGAKGGEVMSAYRIVEVECDVCREAESELHLSIGQLRAQLKEQGWKRRNGDDICSRCIRNEVV